MKKSSNAQDSLNSYRKTAVTVGVIYLAGMVVGISGNVLIQSILGAPDPLANISANSMLVAAGAMLWLLAVAGDAAHGILMFPILRRSSERLAVGYLGARIMDATFVGIMALFILLQIPLGSEYVKAGAPDTSSLRQLSVVLTQAQLYAYDFGMITVGFAGLLLNYVLFRRQLLPRVLGVWGLVGYAVILCGSVLEAMGFNLMLIHTLPAGLWEVFVGGWLIARGFSFSPRSEEQRVSAVTPVVASPARA